MADTRTALLTHLRALDDDATRSEVQSRVTDVDLAAARTKLKDSPADADALADVIGKLLTEDGQRDAAVDAAKLAAQKAPRDASGNDVVLLAGEAIWRITGQPRGAEPYFRRVRRNAPAAEGAR